MGKLILLVEEHRKMAGQEGRKHAARPRHTGMCGKKPCRLRPFPVSLRCILTDAISYMLTIFNRYGKSSARGDTRSYICNGRYLKIRRDSMSEPKKESESKKTTSNVDELKQEIERLNSDLEAMRNDATTFKRAKSELEEDNQKLMLKTKNLETSLAQSYSRFSRFSLMRIETWTNSIMRLIVIFTFAIVGPILLVANLASLQISSVLLDIFKIWLGAAIGISTNLLQKTEKSERTFIPEEQTSASKAKE